MDRENLTSKAHMVCSNRLKIHLSDIGGIVAQFLGLHYVLHIVIKECKIIHMDHHASSVVCCLLSYC